jgi:hypothetical protein
VLDYKGATLIADYGHNPDAMRALVGRRKHAGKRRSVVISGAGDRRDEDIREQTVILGAAFDDVILYQDACQRGRADGEVMALLREGLAGAARTRHVEEIRGEFIAIDTALDRLQPGDLCLAGPPAAGRLGWQRSGRGQFHPSQPRLQLHFDEEFTFLGEGINRQAGIALDAGDRLGNAALRFGRQHKPHVQCVLAAVVVSDLRQRIDQRRHFLVTRFRHSQRGQHEGAAHPFDLEHRAETGQHLVGEQRSRTAAIRLRLMPKRSATSA